MVCIWTPVLFLTFVLSHGSHAAEKRRWRAEHFDDINIDDVIFAEGLLFESAVRSKVECIQRCARRRECTSVTFVRGSSGKACRIHSAWVTSYSVVASSRPGAKTYRRRDKPVMSTWLDEPCSKDKDCKEQQTTCYKGQCVCEPGWYYSISQDICVFVCEDYDLRGHFQRYPDAFILNNNIDEFSGSTVSQCYDRCLTEPTCVTIDYEVKEDRCKVSRVTAASVSHSQWRKRGNVNHYQRYCA